MVEDFWFALQGQDSVGASLAFSIYLIGEFWLSKSVRFSIIIIGPGVKNIKTIHLHFANLSYSLGLAGKIRKFQLDLTNKIIFNFF